MITTRGAHAWRRYSSPRTCGVPSRAMTTKLQAPKRGRSTCSTSGTSTCRPCEAAQRPRGVDCPPGGIRYQERGAAPTAQTGAQHFANGTPRDAYQVRRQGARQDRMITAGYELEEDEVILSILAGLPREFDIVATTLETMGIRQLSINDVLAKPLQAEQRMTGEKAYLALRHWQGARQPYMLLLREGPSEGRMPQEGRRQQVGAQQQAVSGGFYR
jgi:hypothetical protein